MSGVKIGRVIDLISKVNDRNVCFLFILQNFWKVSYFLQNHKNRTDGQLCGNRYGDDDGQGL